MAGAVLLGACTEPTAPAATTFDIGGGTRILVQVRSFKDLRDEHVVRQAFDYSCGAAALATLLTYGYDDPVSEREVVAAMLATLAEDEEALRRKEGFSLLDMQKVAESRGYRAQGFRIAPAALDDLRGPVIVFIEPQGYEHFAVLRGFRGDTAFLADPSRGNLRLPEYAFLDMWVGADGKGIIFAVEPENGGSGTGVLTVENSEMLRPELLSVRQMLDVRPAVAARAAGTL